MTTRSSPVVRPIALRALLAALLAAPALACPLPPERRPPPPEFPMPDPVVSEPARTPADDGGGPRIGP